MQNRIVRRILPLAILGLGMTICSCASRSYYSFVSKTVDLVKQTETVNYCGYTKQLFQSYSAYPRDALNSKGNLKALLLPVEVTDYPFSEKTMTDMNLAFNGESADTKYWESVYSYYNKSSHGALSLKTTIAPIYKTGQTAAELIPVTTNSTSAHNSTISIMRSALQAYKGSLKEDTTSEFDNDKDGTIDAIYLIYSCPDFYTASKQNASLNQAGYWAFTQCDSGTAPSLSSPVGRSFTWASYDFMHIGSSSGIDAHTYIHETGHLLGLDDYYNYDASDALSSNNPPTDEATLQYLYYSPMGSLSMMDHNIMDLDTWSKWALGWQEPYLIDDTLSFPLTVELNSSSNDFLAIPAFGSATNGTPFGEYIMVDVFTPTGLNYLDGEYQYRGFFPRGFTVNGLRITHVDARLMQMKNNSKTSFLEGSPSNSIFKSSAKGNYYSIASSNTPTKSMVSKGYRLSHLMESNGKNTFKNHEEGQTTNPNKTASNATLFQGEKGYGEFNMRKFASFFENQKAEETGGSVALMNDGSEFGYSIQVNGYKKEDNNVRASVTISRG